MATRTIKTSDGEKYSGGSSEFIEYDDYIEHKSFLTTTKIYKRMIVRDSTTNDLIDLAAIIVALIIILLGIVVAMTPVPPQDINTDNTNVSEQENTQFEQEVHYLFDQKYIDPLTDYVEKYQTDNHRTEQVQRVLEERDKRCAEIEQRYQHQKKDTLTLAKLKKGYAHSCPQAIATFVETLEKG